MADIIFLNDTLLAGTTFNAGLEDVLDATGTFKAGIGQFTITNKSGGPFNGYVFELKGTNFTFTGDVPTAGTINAVSVIAPNGTTHIVDVSPGAGAIGDASLTDFYTFLKSANGGVLPALDSLLRTANTVTGSAVADHATSFGFSTNIVFGDGGDDVLSARFQATLIGKEGNDVIRVGNASHYVVAGANQDGSGGTGETNTLQIQGAGSSSAEARFDSITNINGLGFVDAKPPVAPQIRAPHLEADFLPSQIGAGKLSLTLAVNGSTTASPRSNDAISVESNFDSADTSPVNLDLSRWTFTNWNDDRNTVRIESNSAVAVDDHIVGTSVADQIDTFDGDDTLQGGRGSDRLDGGNGNNTFVYGANEAAPNEEVSGAFAGIDTVRVLGSNDFSGMFFDAIDRLEFAGAATATFDQFFIDNSAAKVIGDANVDRLVFQMEKSAGGSGFLELSFAGGPEIDLSGVTFQTWSAADRITIVGTNIRDVINGSSQRDVIDGMDGSDLLQGNGGRDSFRFDTPFGHGVDHIADFAPGQDVIQLDNAVFKALHPGALGRNAFALGTHAASAREHVLFDQETGTLRYDDDGSGRHHAHVIAVLDDVSSLGHGDILVI